MKNSLLFFTFLLFLNANAQTDSNNHLKSIEKKWVKNENYNMTLYAVKDTTKQEIGRTKNSINLENGIITQTMVMENQMFKTDFIDITAYNLANLMPIYHSSNNDQRLITIAYGDTINAVCRSSKDKKLTIYNQAISKNPNYFDSSVYQTILRWLPYKNGYSQDFKIFNFDPNSQTGLMPFKIVSVTTEKITTKKSGIREVWKVTEKYGDTGLITVHYIDKEDRKLWKQEINGGKLVMLLEE